MTAICKITYSATDGHRVPAHYVRVSARTLAAWNKKAAKAARTAALHDETVVAIMRGDDRAYCRQAGGHVDRRGSDPASAAVTPV